MFQPHYYLLIYKMVKKRQKRQIKHVWFLLLLLLRLLWLWEITHRAKKNDFFYYFLCFYIRTDRSWSEAIVLYFIVNLNWHTSNDKHRNETISDSILITLKTTGTTNNEQKKKLTKRTILWHFYATKTCTFQHFSVHTFFKFLTKKKIPEKRTSRGTPQFIRFENIENL